jgi:hypothetical protein
VGALEGVDEGGVEGVRLVRGLARHSLLRPEIGDPAASAVAARRDFVTGRPDATRQFGTDELQSRGLCPPGACRRFVRATFGAASRWRLQVNAPRLQPDRPRKNPWTGFVTA